MSSGALLEGAVPTLQLDPAVRAAVLAVPPPGNALPAPAHPPQNHSIAPLIGK